MKTTPIDGFGSLGVYIDDIDMDHMTDDEWDEIGRIFMRELLVVLRDVKITKAQYVDWISKWGVYKNDVAYTFMKKYGLVPDALDPSTWTTLSTEDRKWIEYRKHMLEETGDGRYVTRIHAGKTDDGFPLGYFSEGDLGWHSNESSSLTFTPCVALLGWSNMQNSATCFTQALDGYEALPESVRSELDEMVVVHCYEPGRVNVREIEDTGLSLQLQRHFCPSDGAETPLICRGINGRKGVHYVLNTRDTIKGLSRNESQKVFTMLDRLFLENEKYRYDHWYGPTKDLCLFDNSITMHGRIGGHGDRKGFRCQFDPSKLLDQPWAPWVDSSVYHQRFLVEIADFVETMKFQDRVRLPVMA